MRDACGLNTKVKDQYIEKKSIEVILLHRKKNMRIQSQSNYMKQSELCEGKGGKL